MTKEHLLSIYSTIADTLTIDINRIKSSSIISKDLEADSLDIVNLSLSLQDQFDIKIDNAEFDGIVTVDDIVNVVKTKLSEESVAPDSNLMTQSAGNDTFSYNTVVTLDNTNAEGNVYYNEINALMGKARDCFALEAIPGFAKGIGKLFFLATAETHGYYKNNLYFGDIVVVNIFVKSILPASAELSFEIFNQEKVLCALGSHIISFMNINGQLQEFPQQFKKILYKYYKQ